MDNASLQSYQIIIFHVRDTYALILPEFGTPSRRIRTVQCGVIARLVGPVQQQIFLIWLQATY